MVVVVVVTVVVVVLLLLLVLVLVPLSHQSKQKRLVPVLLQTSLDKASVSPSLLHWTRTWIAKVSTVILTSGNQISVIETQFQLLRGS